MGQVNHLRNLIGQALFRAVAYGKHLVTGHLVKSNVSGTSPTHTITVQQILGRGEWDGCEGLWWKGVEIKPEQYRFHPGKVAVALVYLVYTADHTTNYITCTGGGLVDGDELYFKDGDLPLPLATGTLYTVMLQSGDTFRVRLASGGLPIDLTSSGSGTLELWKSDPDQGIDPAFITDGPHSGVAWITAQLATGIGDADTKTTPPEGLKGIFRTTKVNDYDDTGTVTGFAYSTSPARQIADLILVKGNKPTSRINWERWTAWRDFMLASLSRDYTAIADFDGIGLTAEYYNGTSFDTLVAKRIDPVIEFSPSTGSPGVGVDLDDFSARFEGYIKPEFTETYTFTLTHDDGAKLWVNGTLVIDAWTTFGTDTGTIALTAGTFYTIKIEWKDTGGTAELRLQWSSASLPSTVVSHRALYPKTEDGPRYETHPFFAGPTRLDDAVRTILGLCNSVVQEVNGKLEFWCLDELTTSSFSFTDSNIADGSVTVTPRDVRNLRNVWQAKFRDVESQYLEYPIDPVIVERPELIETAGRRIDGEAIEMFNLPVHQAVRLLETKVKLAVDSKYQIAFTGNADTWPVLAGDRVETDVEFRDWTAKPCLVLESNDQSSEETADDRTFVLQEWTLS